MTVPNSNIDNKLIDWLYDELGEEERHSFEASVESDQKLKEKLEALQQTRSLMRQLPVEEAPPALSAILMHAAVKEVKPTFSLWSRVTSFLQPMIMNPAVGAMATLLVMVAVVGVVYVRTGNQALEPTVAVESRGAIHSSRQPEEVRASAPLDSVSSDRKSAKREENANINQKEYSVNLAPLSLQENNGTPNRSIAARSKRKVGKSSIRMGSPKKIISQRNLEVDGMNDFAGGSIVDLANAVSPADRPLADKARSTDDRNMGNSNWEEEKVVNLQLAIKSKKCQTAQLIANDIQERNPAYYEKKVAHLSGLVFCKKHIARKRLARKKKRLVKVKSEKNGGLPKQSKAKASQQLDTVIE